MLSATMQKEKCSRAARSQHLGQNSGMLSPSGVLERATGKRSSLGSTPSVYWNPSGPEQGEGRAREHTAVAWQSRRAGDEDPGAFAPSHPPAVSVALPVTCSEKAAQAGS